MDLSDIRERLTALIEHFGDDVGLYLAPGHKGRDGDILQILGRDQTEVQLTIEIQ
jgi:hypothetical protein